MPNGVNRTISKVYHSGRRKSARLASKDSSPAASSSSGATMGPTLITQPERRRLLDLPPAPQGIVRDADLMGYELVGREILICWSDGQWYDAVVIRYYPESDEYKIAYRADEGVEIAPLHNRRWTVAPKKRKSRGRVILDGAIIEFMYPPDGVRYKAMIFDASANGDRIKIAYLDEHTTDTLKGGGWDFLTSSPCVLDQPVETAALYMQDAVNILQEMDILGTSHSPNESP